MVTWEITPADSNTFVLNSGQTVFDDGEEVTDIVIEVSVELVVYRGGCVQKEDIGKDLLIHTSMRSAFA